jgi:ribosomal protein S15P/S13E
LITFADNPDVGEFFKQVKKALAEKYGNPQKDSFKSDPSAEWLLVDAQCPEGIFIHLYVDTKDHHKKLRLSYTNKTLAKQFPEKPDSKLGPAEGL